MALQLGRGGLLAGAHLIGHTYQFRINVVTEKIYLGLLGRIGIEPIVGQASRAEVEGEGELRVLVGTGGQLQGTAADVEVGDAAGGPAVPPAHRQEGQARLFLAGEDFQADAGLLLYLVEDLGRVRGGAHRG